MKMFLIMFGIVAVALAIGCVILYRKGKQMQEKTEAAQEQMRAASQVQSMLIIDKKMMKMKDAGFPKMVLDQTPKLYRNRKVPVVKAKIGPKIFSMMCDEKIFEQIPVKKEVKAVISGIYIMEVKGFRGTVETTPKKKGFFARLKEKAEK